MLGLKTPGKGRTAKIFRTLEPTTFPSAISYFPLRMQLKDVASSGRLVPQAIIVRPTITSGTPTAFAILVAAATTIFAPTIKRVMPSKI